MQPEMSTLDERAEMLFERVAAAARQTYRVAHCDAPMFTCELDYRQRSQHELLALDLSPLAAHLLKQGTQEEDQPGLSSSGWRRPISRSSLNQDTSSAIKRGVSNGVAVSNTTPSDHVVQYYAQLHPFQPARAAAPPAFQFI